jgi:hypothetical protein
MTAEETRTTPITYHEKKWWKWEKKMHTWQWKGELGSDEIAMFLTLPWKMCSKVYLTISEISCPDIIHKCTSNEMKCTHFWITFKLRDRGDDRYVSCIHKKWCRAVHQCLTTAHNGFRQDDQEVYVLSCFLSEADEMQYICAH